MTDPGISDAQMPRHVAIVMDGNGRWAQQRGWPRLAGHRAGTENLRRIVEACIDYGIEVLTVYAFSTENWDRPPDEVAGLMALLEEFVPAETPDLHKNGVRLRHIGDISGLSPKLRQSLRDSMELTKGNRRLILNVAINYGGRAEVVRAVRRLIAAGTHADEVTEEIISRQMDTAAQPDPDLIIRTAGEQRLSNFLIWQAAYSEFWFAPVCWPDFGPEQLGEALVAFSQRQRKFGRVGVDEG